MSMSTSYVDFTSTISIGIDDESQKHVIDNMLND